MQAGRVELAKGYGCGTCIASSGARVRWAIGSARLPGGHDLMFAYDDGGDNTVEAEAATLSWPNSVQVRCVLYRRRVLSMTIVERVSEMCPFDRAMRLAQADLHLPEQHLKNKSIIFYKF